MPSAIRTVLLVTRQGRDPAAIERLLRGALDPEASVHRVGLDSDLAREFAHVQPQLVVVEFDGDRRTGDAIHSLRLADGEVPVVALLPREEVALADHAAGAGATESMMVGGSLSAQVRGMLGRCGALARLLAGTRQLERESQRLLDAERLRTQIASATWCAA